MLAVHSKFGNWNCSTYLLRHRPPPACRVIFSFPLNPSPPGTCVVTYCNVGSGIVVWLARHLPCLPSSSGQFQSLIRLPTTAWYKGDDSQRNLGTQCYCQSGYSLDGRLGIHMYPTLSVLAWLRDWAATHNSVGSLQLSLPFPHTTSL